MCYETFNTWLRMTPNPCWCNIIMALKKVKLLAVAHEIEEKYLCKLIVFMFFKKKFNHKVTAYSKMVLDTFKTCYCISVQ